VVYWSSLSLEKREETGFRSKPAGFRGFRSSLDAPTLV
jgi:hypothetical protein